MKWKPFFINKPLCAVVLCVFVVSLCPPVLVAQEPTIEVSESDINDLINAVNNLTPEEQQSLAASLNQQSQAGEGGEDSEETDEESGPASTENAEEDSKRSSSDSDDDVVLAVSIIAGLALLYWLFRARHHNQSAGFSDSHDPANIASVPLTDHSSLEFESGFIRQSSYGVSGEDLSAEDLASGSVSFKIEF